MQSKLLCDNYIVVVIFEENLAVGRSHVLVRTDRFNSGREGDVY